MALRIRCIILAYQDRLDEDGKLRWNMKKMPGNKPVYVLYNLEPEPAIFQWKEAKALG